MPTVLPLRRSSTAKATDGTRNVCEPNCARLLSFAIDFFRSLDVFGDLITARIIRQSEDALNVFRMSIGPGGKQPLLRSTLVFDEGSLLKGQQQSMVFEAPHPRAGQAKGMKQVLDERWGHRGRCLQG
jgi:hypothetical protein